MPDVARTPVIFIHGLWLHPASWQPWIEKFDAAGYDAGASLWPGDAATVEQMREHPEDVANKGIDDIVEFHASQIRNLPEKPIIIGHSFGGLIAEKLAGMGMSRATVAIEPAPIKGIYFLPWSALRVASVALRNPANRKKSVSLSEPEFRYGFGNVLTPEESRRLYDEWAVPSPGRPLFEAAMATFSPHSPAKVDTHNKERGPMLIVGSGHDHTVPARLSRSAYKLENKAPDETELHIFNDRSHSLVIDHGWQEIADYVLGWLDVFGSPINRSVTPRTFAVG